MGRPAGAKNKPKASATPPADAVPGHNRAPGELTDDERRVLEFMHKKRIVDARSALTDATRAHQNARKRAKIEGCRLSRIDFLILADKENGLDSMRVMMNDLRDAFEWNGSVAVGDQIDLFPEDRAPAVDKARADGKRVGLEGGDCRPPFDASVPQYAAWMEAWHEGQAINLSLMERMKTPKPTEVDEAEFIRGDDDKPEVVH